MSKILVTGGAGFIGSHVTKELLARGDQVVILDDFNNRYDPRLKEARVKYFFPREPKPVIIRGDIADYKLVTEIFSREKFDKVLHLAAWAAVQTSIERPRIYTHANVLGTVNLLEEARKHNINNFVFASSSSVYGGRTKIPFKETDDVSRPISPYAATKVAGELMCKTWHHLYQMPISCLRFFTVYGPWGRPEMALFIFSEAILRGRSLAMRGKNTQRDFTYIDDCVRGVLGALDNPRPFEIYNLGEQDSVSLPRFINAIESALGKSAQIKEVPLPPGDVPCTLADVSKAQRLLNYSPSTKIEDGVKKFMRWYLDWYVPRFVE